MQLTFGLAATPVAATLVVTPRQAGAAPVVITLTVHRRVTSWQYLWIPLIGGVSLALLLAAFTRFTEPRDPVRGRARVRRARFWGRPLYASAVWTFNDSWATNITAVGTVIATVLTASGAVSQLLPGVELGRFSLLLAAAGGITVAAPLVFGALNYRFTRVDPTTAGVALITLPPGPTAILSGRARAALMGRLIPRFRYGGAVVTIPSGTVTAELKAGDRITLPNGTALQLPDGTTMKLPSTRKAVLPDGGKAKTGAIIKVPGGATIDLPAGGTPTPATWSTATLDPGTTLTVPAAATITVLAPQPAQQTGAAVLASPVMAVVANDIAVFAGQALKISAAVTGEDQADPTPRGVSAPGGAKVSFLGRASIDLPAGTCIEAAAAQPGLHAKSSRLKSTTVFMIPHTGQVVAAQMWSLLAAACITAFGIGAELTILGVLGWSLSVASLTVRVTIVSIGAVGAAIVLSYGVFAIKALADARPGSALSATPGTSFTL